ncbi:MAG: hypothetical protein FWD17_12800 [Polyangiaceae bacterium]|nr:hypothetical protein [Polyangiaceae bacterium]
MTKNQKRHVSHAVLGSLLVLAAASACSKSRDTTSDGEKSDNAPVDAVGVPECDAFLEEYERCVTAHAPDARKQPILQQLARNRAAWRSMASDPGARPGLPQACRLARDRARASAEAFGCTW